MTHTVVTSMSDEIYTTYGAEFLSTFAQRWPINVRCVVYLDSITEPVRPKALERFELRPTSEVTLLQVWYDKIAAFPMMRGDIGEGKYDIQFDARQARKCFIESHACQEYGGKVAWLDADVVTHADVPGDFLDRVLPDDKLCAYLGRPWWRYSETGFIAWNADHPACSTFMKGYRNIYLSGAIFMLPGWHDCYGFDILRQQQPAKWFVNLAEGLPECMHPFVNSPLGAFMDHRKGQRKKTRSSKSDLVIERFEPYWQFDAGSAD